MDKNYREVKNSSVCNGFRLHTELFLCRDSDTIPYKLRPAFYRECYAGMVCDLRYCSQHSCKQ